MSYLFWHGISISILSGDNGILNKAVGSKEETRGATVKEYVDLWNINNESDKYAESSILQSKNSLLDDLENQKLLMNDERTRLEAGETITIGSKQISLGNNDDLSKITNDFMGKNETEFFDIVNGNNGYKMIGKVERNTTNYYLQHNDKRYIITFDWDENGYYIQNVSEYENLLKDVTYAITNDINIYQGELYSTDIHDYIENIYELEDIEYICNDENIATIDSNGIIRGINVGETTITLRGVKTGKTIEINLTVSPTGKN